MPHTWQSKIFLQPLEEKNPQSRERIGHWGSNGLSSALNVSNPRESGRIPRNPNFSKWIPVIPREFLAIAGALLGDGPHDPRPDLIPAHAKEFLGVARDF